MQNLRLLFINSLHDPSLGGDKLLGRDTQLEELGESGRETNAILAYECTNYQVTYSLKNRSTSSA
jgi:hypothetical protein